MSWKLIGINTQSNIVAFKAVYTLEGWETDSVTCSYPGVKETEFVQLGAWNTAEQKVIQTWNVYPTPNKEGECASEATTKATLQAAKDYYKAQNIDISKPPVFIAPQKDGSFAIPKKDKSNHIFVVEKAVYTPDKEDDTSYEYTRNIKNASNAVVYSFSKYGTRIMASSMSASFERAYMIGDKVMFLQKETSSSMRHSDISYRLTPMIAVE